MNDRIKQLRQKSLDAIPAISIERAKLLTDFYKSGIAERVSTPIARALAFKYLLENKALYIGESELIVGERGPFPKATPTYPEICTHSLKDFEIIHSREKVSFNVDEETRRIQAEEIIPYWSGRSIRDIIFKEADENWKQAYSAGIFTEFMEQRAPGHTVLDDKIYKLGFKDFIVKIENAINTLNFFGDPEAYKKKQELKAMHIAAEALINFANRYSENLSQVSEEESDPVRKEELKTLSLICRKVPANAPKSFWEALQYYWFVHIGVITELNTWDSFNPGRLDQHLYPFYKEEIKKGTLTKERAKQLLQSFWIKFNNQPAPPKVGVTAQESNTYTDFCLINLGGLDEDGNDAVNELTFMILDVIEEMRLLQPSSMVQLSKKNPDSFLKRALKIVKTGYGQPSIFNTDAIIQEMLRQGKKIKDARTGGASGCVETGSFGKESYILTGYFNIPKILEITLHNGIDPNTGIQLGLQTGEFSNFKSFDELFAAFSKQMKYFLDIKIKGSIIIERVYAEYLPAPFLSILIDDCIEKGRDYNDGGARYNSNYIQGVGLGSITDSLASLKYNIYEEKRFTAADLKEALKNNFKGHENIRELVLNKTPKYGNDNTYADSITKDIFNLYFNLIDGRPNSKGGNFRINLLPTTCHVYFGSVIGAAPDGRLAKEPLSEGISPVQGADFNGPTSVLKSASKIDHIKTGGTLLNQKFSPQIFSTDEGISKVAQLVRTYFRLDGHHIQFNVVNIETLKEAQKCPEKYKDLIVRVAGYSDYFVDLTLELQNEIIKRTEQTTV